MKKLLLIISLLLGGFLFASEGFDESVDRNDPNFVHASILFCGPGAELYGAGGHISIRLQCPHYNLDEVFSYESEPIAHRVIRFFAGDLKMGMFAIPMSDFCDDYQQCGRGIQEYPLNLSPQVKIRLWEVLDKRVEEGAYLRYDYLKRGCAQSALKNLLIAISPESVVVKDPPRKFYQSRYEIFRAYVANFPWKSILVCMLKGREGDKMVSMNDSVVMAGDFIEYLHYVYVEGEPILSWDAPKEIIPQTLTFSRLGCIISPMVVASFLLVLSIIGCFVGKRWIHAALLVFYGLLAVFETYISIFSNLPAAAWNVLLIAFNPLPLIFWKWRKYWGLPYAAVLIVWSAWVFLAPHLPTDPAFAILALAYSIIFYFRGRH